MAVLSHILCILICLQIKNIFSFSDATFLRRSLVVICDYFPIIMPYGMHQLCINIERPHGINNYALDWDEEKYKENISKKWSNFHSAPPSPSLHSSTTQSTNIFPTIFQAAVASFHICSATNYKWRHKITTAGSGHENNIVAPVNLALQRLDCHFRCGTFPGAVHINLIYPWFNLTKKQRKKPTCDKTATTFRGKWSEKDTKVILSYHLSLTYYH